MNYGNLSLLKHKGVKPISINETHNLNLKLGIDFLSLLRQDNITGAMYALGCNEEDIITVFSNNVINKISKCLKGYKIISINDVFIESINREPEENGDNTFKEDGLIEEGANN